MNLIILHKDKNPTTNSDNELLRFATSIEPVTGIILDGLSRSSACYHNGKVVFAVPEQWKVKPWTSGPQIIPYKDNVPIASEALRKIKQKLWFIISNGRFVTQINSDLLKAILASTAADIVAVNADPELLAYREKIRSTAQGKVAGFRRFYCDSVEPAPLPADWPCHLFIKTNVLDQILNDRTLPKSFCDFTKKCQAKKLLLQAINVAGTAIDLETEDGLLAFCSTKIRDSKFKIQDSNSISHNAKFVGQVLLGENINIGPKAIIVGPTIIGNNIKIGAGSVINSSIVGTGVRVPDNQFILGRVIKGPQPNWKHLNQNKKVLYSKFEKPNLNFRYWPRFSYAGCFKRIADCVVAIIVLILFAPVIPFIALAIKLNSSGTVFFRDKRQGLHGKEFDCLKFRTMLVGADRIQDKLRVVSQVDGPQFKIDDDPRISTVGRFLRDTYIDEIPQFVNVLLGQMSVVGPRPSPESENTLCPFWRDARLSVRPGITGLWQVCRTRQPMKDFQEWIHYDIEYIRNLSLKLDLRICWQTVKKLFDNFINQF